MRSKKNIVLVGMMGSGKSIIGKILAKKVKLQFIDIDAKIEKNQKSTISEIFKKKGENYFREIEEIISISYLKLEEKIISLGGGGYINANIRKQCKINSISVWLNWKPGILIDRINNNKNRPLANNLDSNEIKQLIIERSKIYNLSDHQINCDKLKKNQIVEKIIEIYEKL